MNNVFYGFSGRPLGLRDDALGDEMWYLCWSAPWVSDIYFKVLSDIYFKVLNV